MTRLYHYVGSAEVRQKARHSPAGVVIASVDELESWMRHTGQQPDPEGLIAATFVIDEQGQLRVADRASEHVACAAGGPVLSAGEMFFDWVDGNLAVVEVSNQSTGYCPEPESWPAVSAALDSIPLPHPGRFTREMVFRRCTACGQINLVKDGWFICSVCATDLPLDWNCSPLAQPR